MEPAVECTHCGVVMTSWSVPNSPIRYFQCPFCQRTHSSHYGEVFRSHAGARLLGSAPRSALPSEIPMARPEDMRWATIKAAATRWYARVEADEHRNATLPRPARARRGPIPLTVAFEEPRPRDPLRDPLVDLVIDVELEPGAAASVAAEPQPVAVAVAAGAAKRR